ncbi:Rieske 2Fe-2S domain-containing protein [Mycolicibacterium hodleri]|uniref:Aromatic ring-hydroxylating dioxygenase subunit alpha n=1 Tax=Mycolicibacterium hodleri TaxID=49897 RepID=A0A502EGA2_9MYCO|nr:Rieske 2Fe-2S domain-containing protein [Mycolicibacterium hodleri]TPG36477.1 aromatic ring-hydroxylating dioxygenase subunit alpha [Mycolicibacterium hodleri]
MSNYPKKCWYVAATSDEFGDAPLQRRLLDVDVVLWRAADGQPIAFENRCAHRAFPLSNGEIVGDLLVCGYHGCTYDRSGACVRIPSQPQVPAGMNVKAFHLVEEPPFVWIWLGPPGTSAGSRPPRSPWINQPGWSTFADAWGVAANYLMVHEHYLDFSYAPVVHRSDLPPGLDSMPAFNSVEVTETTVSYERILQELPLADWQSGATGLDGSIAYKHRESGTFVSPAMHRQHWNIEASDGTMYTTTRTHALTPESPNSTHVFMQSSRNYNLDDDQATKRLTSFLAEVAQRDKSVLEMAAGHSGYDGWRGGVEFQADAAALRARRIVAVMLSKEAGRSAIRPGLAPKSRADSLSP